jgi:hypothetical protein
MFRPIALAVCVALTAAVIGWSLFWYAAARQTSAVITAWIEHEAEFGRKWTCPERRVGGYPLDIEVSCANLRFEGSILDKNFAGSLHGFHAASAVLRPDRVTAKLEPPFAGKTPSGDLDFTLQWAGLTLTLEGQPDALGRVMLTGEQLSLKGSIAGLKALDSTAQTVQASATPSPGLDTGIDFDIALNGATIASLSNMLGLTAPLDAHVAGALTKADFSGAGTFAERVEKWRLGGGRLDLKSLHVTSGAAKFDAHGVLDLDAGRRPQGKLDTAFEGMNPILTRLGVDPRLLAAGSLLTSFLGNSPGKASAAEATRLPLRIADGWVSIGPIRTPLRLPPLY